jgi:hypothetical protein
MAFFAQTAACFYKKLIITLIFEKNGNFLPKSGIELGSYITSTPELN